MHAVRRVCALRCGVTTRTDDTSRVHVISARHCGRMDVYRKGLMLTIDAYCGSQEGGAGEGA